jgi:hypothetical protein
MVWGPNCLRARLSQGQTVQGQVVQVQIVWGPIVQGRIVPVQGGARSRLNLSCMGGGGVILCQTKFNLSVLQHVILNYITLNVLHMCS